LTAYKVLIVDDEPDIRELVEITLGRMGIDTTAAADVAAARQHLNEQAFDLCLTDLHLPDGNGLDLVHLIAREQPELPVAVITAFGSMDVAIGALKAGAFDFVQKPVDLEQLRALVSSALKLHRVDPPRAQGRIRLIGDSEIMRHLGQQITKLARSQAPVYISGESGSGKELAARLIHEQSPRADQRFVPVNCGAIPGELMESEFFGHTRGSFTGAVADKEGLFQAAHGGTLFLDEVADLPLTMQVKLLRAIQEKAIRAVGAAEEHPINVRVLCATHKDLNREVAEGRFRQDLYYRLNVIELPMPSLRQRREDIAALAAHMLERLASTYAIPAPVISRPAMQALERHGFPGNVRELENILERAVTLCEDGRIEVADLRLDTPGHALDVPEQGPLPPLPATAGGEPAEREGGSHSTSEMRLEDLPPGTSLEHFMDQIERKLITEALEAARWNKTAAAKRLGITFRALRYRLKKLALE